MELVSMSPTELNLFFVVAIGLSGCLIGLLGLLLAPQKIWTFVPWAAAVFLAGTTGAAIAFGLDLGLIVALGGLAIVAVGFILVRWSLLFRVAGWLGRHLQTARVQGGLILVLSFLFVLAWGLHAEMQLDAGVDEPFLPGLELDPNQLQEVGTVQTVTDKGRPVPLCTVPDQALTEKEKKQLELDTVKTRDLAQKQIRTGPMSESYNCHGWVFASGLFWVRGRDVPAILEDNGYFPTSTPRPGDVIVYRDETGAVSHTGLVRTATADGLVLIESKWGWLGRYIHTPVDTCYGDRWAFYRSERDTHRLAGLGGETLPMPVLAE